MLFLIAKLIDTEIFNFLKIKVNMEKTDVILPVMKPNFVVNIMGPAVAFLLYKLCISYLLYFIQNQ